MASLHERKLHFEAQAYLYSLQVQEHVVAEYPQSGPGACYTIEGLAGPKKRRVSGGPCFHIRWWNSDADSGEGSQSERGAKTASDRTHGRIVDGQQICAHSGIHAAAAPSDCFQRFAKTEIVQHLPCAEAS